MQGSDGLWGSLKANECLQHANRVLKPCPLEFNCLSLNPVLQGGTMRLGSRRTMLQTVNCTAAKLYQQEMYIDERHRHRYEVNPSMVPELEAEGLQFVGRDETGERMEIVELTDNPSDHPYFVAAQFHPEFKSRCVVPPCLISPFSIPRPFSIANLQPGIHAPQRPTSAPLNIQPSSPPQTWKTFALVPGLHPRLGQAA